MQQFIRSLIYGCDNSLASTIPVVVQSFLDGFFLSTVIRLLKNHQLSSTTATLQDRALFNSLGASVERELHHYEKGTDLTRYPKDSHDHHILYFGRGPADPTAGCMTLLPWRRVVDRPMWPMTQIEFQNTFVLKQASVVITPRTSIEKSSAPPSSVPEENCLPAQSHSIQEEAASGHSIDEHQGMPKDSVESALNIERLSRHKKVHAGSLHGIATIHWQSHVIDVGAKYSDHARHHYKSFRWNPIERRARMESLGAFGMEEISERQEYFVNIV